MLLRISPDSYCLQTPIITLYTLLGSSVGEGPRNTNQPIILKFVLGMTV
jgi:hypothetical protein